MKNQMAFTTSLVLSGQEKIHFVFHDSDGDWHFLPNREVSVEDSAVVALGGVPQIDSSVEQLLSLPRGNMAERQGLDEWQIKKI